MVQALGDLDSLLERVESVSATVDGSESRLQGTIAALDKAGDGYRLAVTAFTESAKAELIEFTQRQSTRLAGETLEDVRASMHAAASATFRSEASDRAAQLGVVLHRALKDLRRSRRTQFLEHLLTTAITSALTAGLVLLALRLPGP